GNCSSRATVLNDVGRFVSFASFASNLVAEDNNSLVDVFTHDLMGGSTTRESVASDGTQGAGTSGLALAINRDGRYVAFASSASNLAPGLSGSSTTRIFVRDRLTGQTTLESIGPSGETLASSTSAISCDGRF